MLETDAQVSRRMNHPQGDMIAEDIRQLKERLANLRIKHAQIYNMSPEIVAPHVNWSKMIEEKQGLLNSRGFATDLPSLEGQVEEHNIFHNEVKAIGPHINADGDKEYVSGLQVKYQKLLSGSQQRQQDLNSLQDYMQRCTNELYWLDQQEKDRMQYDWSDHNLDYPSRRRLYENFINRNLEPKEDIINKLHAEGEAMVQAGHPGKNAVEAHMEAVHADWKEYLNLLICEESHLKYMEDYHQFHRDAKDVQDLMKKVNTDLDQKYNPDFKDKYQLESLLHDLDDQEKALDKYDEVVNSLQKRSHQVVPLKYRRETPLKPVPVEALCDFECEEGKISRGSQYTMHKNKGEKWEVTDSAGKKLNAPAVCFMIPPTDPEAIALTDSIGSQNRSVKQKMAGSRNALARRYDDMRNDTSGDAQDVQGRQMLAGLDKVNSDLDKQEKAITSRLRPPLEQNRAVQDSMERVRDLKNITNDVQRIEPDKSKKIQECEAFLSAVPNSSSAPLLKSKVEDTKQKSNRVNQLLACAQEKVEGANRLENSLQKGKDLLSTYEIKLAQDETMPEDLKALDKKQQELTALGSELQSKKATLNDAEQNLQRSKKSCSTLASQFQEHCPDIERQESEMKKLNQRYDNLNQQLQNRTENLQKAKSTYAGYRNGCDNVNKWISSLPNYEPRETDGITQVDTKLKNQRFLLNEIAGREQDVQEVANNAQQYQQAVKNYEFETEKLRSFLDLENGQTRHLSKRPRIQSPASKVKDEEAVLAARFTEVNAVNKQRLQNLEFAQNLLRQKPEVEIMQESVQTSRSERPAEETWRVQNMLDDEVQRRHQLETEIKTIQNEIIVLQGQKPQETVVKKELVKKVPDPQLDDEHYKLQEKVVEEQRRNKLLQDELESLKGRIRSFEYEQKVGGQEYVVKEVLRIEMDKDQQEQVLRLREELEELKRQKGTRENEINLLKKRIDVLSDEKNKEQEKITEKEVVKLQNDPQLTTEYRLLQENMERETTLRRQQEAEFNLLQEKLKRLEKERALAEGKITVKEVLKVEKDLASEREMADLRRQYEEETAKVRTTVREKNELIHKIQIMEEENAKVLIQEKVREIVRPDPKAESEVANLRMELIEQERHHRSSEENVVRLQNELTTLKSRGPQVEVKEVIKEVIKYKTDPETQKEMEGLREEILDKTRVIERSELEMTQLKQEIQSWKEAKPQVQMKEVVKETLQYREDPKTKEEVESLRAKLAEEQKKRLDLERERMSNEEKIRQKERELAQVKERVVQQEVVKYEEDHALKSEVNSFSKNIENELKQKDSLQEELRKLQWRKSELERQLEDLERERQARREAELEIQKLRLRLNELEQRDLETKEKVTVKQKVVLQQDPQQEKDHNLLKLQVEEERHNRQLLETELDALRKKLLSMEKLEVKEKVVFTEKVEVERDAETENEIQKLKSSLEEESKRKRELDAEVDRLQARMSEIDFNNSKTNKELEYLREEVHKLQTEKQSLQLETRRLQSEIVMTAKEAEDLRNMTQIDNRVNLDSRFQSLNRELEDLRKISRDKDAEIEELQTRLNTIKVKREQRENHLRRSIVVIDPDTGREMTPEAAHKLGLIDWKMFVNLQSQECDWEETTIKGPNGESSVIVDRKSGKKFDIDDALRSGRITKYQYDRYLNKEMSIQEFAVLVSGKK
ncbi:periplakin isoform X2 [Rhinatrema bivittatum]|nr:periplakin isoform X2 [Rhinatrema bivittatum]XP_029432186.1 periplakin isoform X2 [Rhinatrema bivittatum]XP_029432187.1 periplakin isoform X2 [Rhinatrema bivittatum]